MRRYYGKKELQAIAQEMGIDLTYTHQEIIEAWCRQLMGILQALWDRGNKNEAELEKYSAIGKRSYIDEDARIKPE